MDIPFCAAPDFPPRVRRRSAGTVPVRGKGAVETAPFPRTGTFPADLLRTRGGKSGAAQKGISIAYDL